MNPPKFISLLKKSYPDCSHLLNKKWRIINEESKIPSTGHCYVATEALFYLCGGLDSGLKPMYAKYDDCTHWWLVDGNDKIYDPTDCQYGDDEPPYHLGKRAGFLNGYLKPSKRAKAMMEIALNLKKVKQ